MKRFKSYIPALLAFVGLCMGFTACQDDVDAPSSNAPVAKLQPNMTIFDLKKMYWDDATNFIDTIGVENGVADDKEYVIHGRVISSDEAGNVFKSLIIQDETAAIAMSINSYNLYLKYRRGQEVVLNVKGMYIGKYNGLLQLGYPEWYANGNAWEATFMAPEFFYQHVELNGWPDLAKVDTIAVNRFSEIGSNPDELCKWQSQLVRFNNVYFENGGNATFSEYQSSGVNQAIVDADGNTLNVRTSGYANFWNQTLPVGNGDVVGICSYYGSAWQITLIDADGCMNFGNPTVPAGSESNPYTVEEVIANESASLNTSGWVKGFIVGAVAPLVENVTSNDDIEWSAPTNLRNTLVIAPTADTRDYTQCLVVGLPASSELMTYGNLREHPENLGKEILIKGTFQPFMGTYGITDNRGTAADFKIDGVDLGPKDGDGTEAAPFSCAQVIAMNPQSTTDAVKTGVWTEGYIVGYYTNYAGHFEAAGAVASNILISDNASAADVSECVSVQLVASTDARAALNLLDNPGNIGKKVTVYGDVMKYNTLPGIKNTSNYSIDGSTPGTDPTPTPDPTGDASYGYTTTVAGGNTYAFVAEGKVAKALEATYNYGYIQVDDVTVADNKISASESCGFTLEAVSGGYAIKDNLGRYYYMTGTYNSFNVATSMPAEGGVWTVAVNADGRAVITNVAMNKTLQYDTQYNSFGAYADVRGVYPMLFLKGSNGSTVPDTPTPDPDPTPDTPVTPSGEYKGDFNTFNNGTPKSSYGTYTNSTGWKAENACILGGSEDKDSNPYFTFIGKTGTLAVCLNGKTSAPGVLTSPLLAGGIKTLTFKYGFAFNETQCSFTVKILQGGTVVKEDTVDLDSVEKTKVYDYSLAVNVSGDFQIVIVNNCKSALDSNKDRVAIWNLTWD